MSSTGRTDLAESRQPITNNSRTFKKSFQTVDTPPVTDNINDQYFHDPPNNLAQPTTRGTGGQWPQGGVYEDADPKREGVLGDEPLGKQTKEAVLGEMVNENTVHGGLTGA
ncbi:hypothetical protein EUX98_g5922 [Antrodiella citrinella]|uniref:Uncharacterized protein n=1 Tax=Antrodiella citrinella TaxID=2447956 RepID=A0A4S4MQ91_9APHY|nr:hypothetical protein EUX98_g5922 [Antrodiella citrinella]